MAHSLHTRHDVDIFRVQFFDTQTGNFFILLLQVSARVPAPPTSPSLLVVMAVGEIFPRF